MAAAGAGLAASEADAVTPADSADWLPLLDAAAFGVATSTDWLPLLLGFSFAEKITELKDFFVPPGLAILLYAASSSAFDSTCVSSFFSLCGNSGTHLL